MVINNELQIRSFVKAQVITRGGIQREDGPDISMGICCLMSFCVVHNRQQYGYSMFCVLSVIRALEKMCIHIKFQYLNILNIKNNKHTLKQYFKMKGFIENYMVGK